MKRKLPKYVHRKSAKGRTYYYFDTGARDEKGNRILSRLPDIRNPTFGTALQAAQGQRTKRKGAEGTKTFDWLCKLYERSPEFKKRAEATKQLYALHLGYANAMFRSADGRSWPLPIITAEHTIALRDKYADRPGTANAILKALGAVSAWARKPGRRYIKESLTEGVEPLEMGEYQPWSEALVEDALNDKEVRLPVALLYFLGQRIGDTVRMGPQMVSGGAIKLTQQKTRKALTIAMHSRLVRIIEEDAPKGAMLYLLNERGKPMTGQALRLRLQKWALARGQSIVPHGLRKSAVNALLKAECSVAEVSAITGQSLQMVEHYAKQRDNLHLSRSAILKFERQNKTGTGGERENAS